MNPWKPGEGKHRRLQNHVGLVAGAYELQYTGF